MNKNLLITVSLSIVALCIATYALFWHMSHFSQEISIQSDNNVRYNVVYYASKDGQWLDGASSLRSHGENKATLRNNSPISAASYQIAIGDRLGRFTCTADIVQPGLGQKARFIAHQGDCRTEVTSGGSLELVIDSRSTMLNSAQHWR